MKKETTAEEKIKAFADKHKIGLKLARVPYRMDEDDADRWSQEAKHFIYTLYIKEGARFDKKIRGHYSQGSAIKGVPTIADILNALNMDTQGIEGTSFEMWAPDFGYDTDSRKAYRIYEACLKESQQLKELLGISGLEELHELEGL